MATPQADSVVLNDEAKKRHELIVRNLQEVLGDAQLQKHLANQKNISVYWGTATTGRPHVGYFVPMQKISDFLRAGIRVTILFADLHGYLDNLKSTFELLEKRVQYYEHVIKALLGAFDVPLDKLNFAKGSSYQLTEAYTQDVLRLCANVSQRDALKAGAEVVKQVQSPCLSGMMYPLLQALDEQYLKVDAQLGGVDQRKIFILAEEQLPKLKLGKRYHFMNPMVPGLTGAKMSSSEKETKIDLLDPPELVEAKIKSAACPKTSGDEEAQNGVLSFYEFVIFPTIKSVDLKGDGNLRFENSVDLNAAFNDGKVSEEELKAYLVEFLNGILGKVRHACDNEEMKEILTKAYPVDDGNEIVNEKQSESSVELNANGKDMLQKLANGLELIESPKLLQRIQSGDPVRVLWRVSAKGHFHLGYLKSLLELRRLKRLGCQCTILISDLGGYLDNEKCPWNARTSRVDYYERVLKEFLSALDLSDVPIKRSDEHQFKRYVTTDVLVCTIDYSDYTINMYKSACHITRDESALVQGNSLGCHLCPIYHFLDVHFADISGSCRLPLQATLVHKTVNGTDGARMSASSVDSQLDPADTPKQLKSKIAKSFCEPGNLNGNIAIQLAEALVLPLHDFKRKNEDISLFNWLRLAQTIERSAENGGNLEIRDYAELERLFVDEKLHPADLKSHVVQQLNKFLEPIRSALDVATLSKLLKAAFPPAPKGAKKK
ncbi:Tyrosine--tRNA ligase, cytoplasmic [Aphelenchoides besseyi]|nr:Tyrosine--tRNA ligase, cytoplasmic [Aphelenchoides besseyi]